MCRWQCEGVDFYHNSNFLKTARKIKEVWLKWLYGWFVEYECVCACACVRYEDLNRYAVKMCRFCLKIRSSFFSLAHFILNELCSLSFECDAFTAVKYEPKTLLAYRIRHSTTPKKISDLMLGLTKTNFSFECFALS